MLGCILTAGGAQFDVDAFIKTSSWQGLASVFRRGETTGWKRRPVQECSSLAIRISDPEEDALLGPQIKDAMEFLQQEREEIQRLASFSGVDVLEFRIGLFWCRDTHCQFHTLPPDFLRAAGELKVAVTLCVYGVSREEGSGRGGAEPDASPNGGPAEHEENSRASGGPPSVS